MSKKRKLLIMALITFVLVVSIVLLFNYVYDDKKSSQTSSKSSSENILKTTEKAIRNIQNNLPETETENKDIQEDEKSEQDIEESQNSNKEVNQNRNENKSVETYVAPKTNSNTTNQSTQSQTPQQTQPSKPQEPSCIPKKFYTTFRADFKSEADCESTYNHYHNIDPNKYLGFICSYQTDDCGVTYYMLTFFDVNGNYFGYNEIN